MAPSGPETTFEELLTHAGWVRGLARRLIREDAEDVVQDVWVQAAQHPPRGPGSPRGWLATVLRNRAFNQKREGVRRHRRELATEELTDTPPTPHELAERMDLHRRLADLIAELPDDLRQVVHLRFVEEQSSADIARLLQQPAGTIRWRLHEALARLRAALDQRGGRRAWIRALAPLAGWRPDEAEVAARGDARGKGGIVVAGGREIAATATGRSVRRLPLAGLVLAVGMSVLLVVGFLLWRLRAPGGQAGAAGSGGPPPTGLRAAQGASGGPGVPRLTGLAAVVPADPACPEVEAMRRFLDELKQAGEPWLELPDLYREGSANPTLEAVLQPILAAQFARWPPGCEPTLSCRGSVCELVVLVPDGTRTWDCQPQPRELRDRLSSGLSARIDSGTPFHDPLRGKSFQKATHLLRFHRPDGAAVPRHQREGEPELTFDFGRRPPTAPADLSSVCRDRWRELEREHDRFRRRLSENHPDAVFETSSPDPAIQARVTERIRQTLARPGGPLPVSIACRGPICALSPLSRARDWYTQAGSAASDIGYLRFSRRLEGGSEAVPAYLVVWPVAETSPTEVPLAFFDSFDLKATLRGCQERSAARGRLDYELEVPETTDEPSHRVSFHVGGELGGSPVARCLAAAVEAASARFRVPATPASFLSGSFDFPLDAAAIDREVDSLRRRLLSRMRPPRP
jgi:RNA polymerase sigma-70 factor, ECF subfamily